MPPSAHRLRPAVWSIRPSYSTARTDRGNGVIVRGAGRQPTDVPETIAAAEMDQIAAIGRLIIVGQHCESSVVYPVVVVAPPQTGAIRRVGRIERSCDATLRVARRRVGELSFGKHQHRSAQPRRVRYVRRRLRRQRRSGAADFAALRNLCDVFHCIGFSRRRLDVQ